MSLAQAKKLRANMTDAERRLWYWLRAHRFDGFKFKRQVPIGPYVVDFACPGRKLVVEVDGGQHADNSNDVVRDSYLKGEGFRILRFWNNDVLQNTRGVLETIYSALGTPSPGARARHPLPFGERGKKEHSATLFGERGKKEHSAPLSGLGLRPSHPLPYGAKSVTPR